MKNTFMRKRIAAAAAAALMSAGFAAGTITGTFYITPNQLITASAATSSVTIASSTGYGEGMYATWSPVTGASGYNVYVDGTQIDSMLIRQYSGYFRADAVGLKAGSHTMKVVPVIGGKEDTSKAAQTQATAYAHDRSGYGFVGGSSSGAYNDDGTLKSGATVIYVTNSNKDSVTATLPDKKGAAASLTGIQNIITDLKSNTKAGPVCIRFIGNITDPAVLNKGDLYIDTATCGLTIEGIGNDTTFNGFGLVMKNSSNVEVRNIGFMNCNSSEGDDCGLQQGNNHIWVHNCDFFYGDAGSDADQVKGDGALDTKTSTYVTHSYNHFWDNGKCNLQGMKSESTENYITYHHNWYDHSDSRHPRIRTCTVHIYNNYYDGNAKYGIGVTMGASAFAENNYFRNCKYPMLISGQGSDVESGGTFSGETGGVIKSFGNYIEGAKAYLTQKDTTTDFDAYEASSRTEQVPGSIKSKSGSTSYSNFDTASGFYKYTPDAAADVPAIVTAKAGRVDGGDFKWQFNNSEDDAKYAVDDKLKAALVAYKDSITAIGSGFKEDNGSAPSPVATTAAPVVVTTVPVTAAPAVTQAPVTATPSVPTTPVTGSDVIYASPNGGGDGRTMQSPTDVVSAIKAVPAGGTVYLLDGTYKLSQTIMIDQNNSGTDGKLKTLSAYPGAKPVLDFSAMEFGSSNRGFVLDGSYWHFYNFAITGAGDNGILLSGNHNKIELMKLYGNRDTGLQISRYRTDAANISDWPSYNLVLNCTSFNNLDTDNEEDADGFAAKLTCGEGNVFDGCMAYNNSDDGWDLFAKTETGPIGAVTIKNCIAFRNGRTETSQLHPQNDGNGFKLGGSGVGSPHQVINCLAFENLHCGFTDNNNPKLAKLVNCTAVNNGEDSKPNFSAYRCTTPGADFQNLISAYVGGRSLGESDKFYGTISNSVAIDSGKTYQIGSAYTTANKGVKGGGTAVSNLTASDFTSISVPKVGTDFHTAWRDSSGSISNGHVFETVNGTYYKMGYRFDGSSAPETPVQTQAPTQPSQPTATTAAQPAPVDPVPGGYVHNFTDNGTSSSFYTITGNLSTAKGTASYNGLTLTQCLKMETATGITFNAPASGKLTLVFGEAAGNAKIDGNKVTSDNGVLTVDLAAGTHEITKADSCNLFYMVFAASGSDTPVQQPTEAPVQPTSSAPAGQKLAGDANDDGKVNVADAVAVLQYVANKSKYPLSDQGAVNADCDGSEGITGTDAIYIQKIDAGIN